MKTKTECKSFSNCSELKGWIDEMYEKYGEHIINVSTCAFALSLYNVKLYGFITILKEKETNNID